MSGNSEDDDKYAQTTRNHVLKAAVIGGAAAATAGAIWSARALARRNGAGDGKPLNEVMATAVTACELAHSKGAQEPRVPAEPKIPSEPKIRS